MFAKIDFRLADRCLKFEEEDGYAGYQVGPIGFGECGQG